ncbi:hypothetical protein DMA11_08220 [Marinilabiliaceae bacterium JC017]|nr:hypothetical protein DMA11_08220 [Marinilabiliaceae bacterium JC017]
MNLHGSIKSLHEKKTNITGELIMTKETIFTNTGMVKSTEYIHSFNNTSNKSINHYDFRNRIVKQEFLINDSLMTSQEYLRISPHKDSILLYDSNGELINTGTLKYANDWQPEVIKLYNTENYTVYCDTSKYDSKGRLIEQNVEQHFDPEFKRKYQYRYKYDSIGRIQVLSTYDSFKDSITVERYKYKLDEKNNWIEKQILSKKGDSLAIIIRTIKYK